MLLILEILYHKRVISHDPLQKIYPNLARTCENKFCENKTKFNWLNLLKKIYYVITGAKKSPPFFSLYQIGLNRRLRIGFYAG